MDFPDIWARYMAEQSEAQRVLYAPKPKKKTAKVEKPQEAPKRKAEPWDFDDMLGLNEPKKKKADAPPALKPATPPAPSAQSGYDIDEALGLHDLRISDPAPAQSGNSAERGRGSDRGRGSGIVRGGLRGRVDTRGGRGTGSQHTRPACKRCGHEGHDESSCPRGHKCGRCGWKNHWEADCDACSCGSFDHAEKDCPSKAKPLTGLQRRMALEKKKKKKGKPIQYQESLSEWRQRATAAEKKAHELQIEADRLAEMVLDHNVDAFTEDENAQRKARIEERRREEEEEQRRKRVGAYGGMDVDVDIAGDL
jgi:hypothetical protein